MKASIGNARLTRSADQLPRESKSGLDTSAKKFVQTADNTPANTYV